MKVEKNEVKYKLAPHSLLDDFQSHMLYFAIMLKQVRHPCK